MSIYIENIDEGWREAFIKFEAISGFEIMYQEEIALGESSYQDVWDANLEFLEDVLADCQNIKTPNTELEKL